MSKPKLAVIVDGNLAAAGPGDKDNIDGLGTAATRDVGTESGNVLEVGAFGLGGGSSIAHTQPAGALDNLIGAHFLSATQTVGSAAVLAGFPELPGSGDHSQAWAALSMGTPTRTIQIAGECFGINQTHKGRLFTRSKHDAWLQPWTEILTEKSVLSTTGQSTQYPMTQKAVTDALANVGALAPSSSTYEYDALGRVNKVVTPNGNTVIGYNPDGTVETISYPTGRVETFTYDASGNVTAMTATGG